MSNIEPVVVVDSIMGTGKTTFICGMMKQSCDEHFLYVAPFVNEDIRIVEATMTTKQFVMPSETFYDPYELDDPYLPKPVKHTKRDHLKNLIYHKRDIASTHELFKRFDEETKNLLFWNKYTLVLDEVVEVITPYKDKGKDRLKKHDVNTLLSEELIVVDPETNMVTWNAEKSDYDGRYNDIKRQAENDRLMLVSNTFFLWRYPPEIFNLFQKIYILTYLFEGSIMYAYFNRYSIPFIKKSIRRNENGEYEMCDYYRPDTTRFKDLVHIYKGELNENFPQLRETALSSSWFQENKNKRSIDQIRKNIGNYFRKIAGGNTRAPADSLLWTTYSHSQKKLNGKDYSSHFIACNCRSTNDYADTYNLVYAVNWYLHTFVGSYFKQNNICVNIDLYALGNMLQWIWRSRIRNDEPVNIYIPSKRMRKLLMQWLNGQISVDRVTV